MAIPSFEVLLGKKGRTCCGPNQGILAFPPCRPYATGFGQHHHQSAVFLGD
jgi:hypothetical protein